MTYPEHLSPQQHHAIDRVRLRKNGFQNQVVDSFLSGRLSRRGFVSAAVGVGFTTLFATTLAACAPVATPGATPGASGTARQLFRLGTTAPGRKVDPLLMGSNGSLNLIAQVGEYLSISDGSKELTPWLATSWQPNDDASVWTFTIREGVTFNDGTTMTAKDVADTFNRLADPANGSNALETIGGILSSGGATAPDEKTVVFQLERPNANWAWLASSDNTSSVILPGGGAGIDNYEASWAGTGPWILENYVTDISATFRRNDDYWGAKASTERLDVTLYEDASSMALGLAASDVDAISNFSLSSGRVILDAADNYNVVRLDSSAHSPWNLNVTEGPLADKRIRQALALTLDRETIVRNALGGYGSVGNDSPFAPLHEVQPTNLPQRKQDIEAAKSLVADAGYAETGVTIAASVWDTGANSEWAQLAKEWAAQAGITVNLTLMDTTTFLGDGEFGSAPQLDSETSIADWGSRGIPDPFLTAQLSSDGVRNAAHWHNSEFDAMLDGYTAEPDLERRMTITEQMGELLLDETPVIYPYFADALSASAKDVSGVTNTPMGHTWVNAASFAD